MRDLLANLGFYMFQGCNCGGTRKERWRNDEIGGLYVRILPNMNYFEIHKHGNLINQGKDHNLETTIKEYI